MELIACITSISLAKDCQILPRAISLAMLASQENMHNKHQAAPLNSQAKMVYVILIPQA